MSANFKVMFVYYNPRKMSLVPQSIAIFSRLLKSAGVTVSLFDTTMYQDHYGSVNSDGVLEQNLTVKQFSSELERMKDKIVYKTTDYREDFVKAVDQFKPDLLAVTAAESTFEGSIELLKKVRHTGVPVVMGGVFCTFSPETAISYEDVDVVCVGEGEKAIVELVECMRKGKDHSKIESLWVKGKNGEISKNPVSRPVDLDSTPLLDLDIFEDSRFYRAMSGKIYKMFPVETHRGCVKSCTFCNSPLQNKMYKEATGQPFFRRKSIPKVFEEIDYCKKRGAEYLFFWADDFFLYSDREIAEFCERYSAYKLPFFCQAHPHSISRHKVQALLDVGMHRVGLGIEHGNEEFRRRVINRHYSNEMLIKNLKILEESGVEFNVNNIIGFPEETPELVMDTVELNRRHKADDISCSIFTPFRGTPLRDLCVRKGYLKDVDAFAPSDADASILEMPQFTQPQILGKRRTFIMYIKFPKDRWPEIRQAEALTPEGDAVWRRLREECVASYFTAK